MYPPNVDYRTMLPSTYAGAALMMAIFLTIWGALTILAYWAAR